MIPPRFTPPGVIQLYEDQPDGTRVLLQELPSSSKNRSRLQNMRNDLLMIDSTRKLILTENNALR